MLVHVVLIKWNDKITEETFAAITENFSKLPTAIPQIKCYEFGPNVGIIKDGADYALVAKFDNAIDLKAYIEHPAHQEFMTQYSTRYIHAFESVQFELSIKK